MTKTKKILPAEWAPQRFVQLTWPHKDTDWAPYLDEITETFVLITEAITRFEPVVIASQVPELTKSVLEQRLTTEQMSKVTIVECPTNDTWARDHGGITLSDGTVLDFRFNGWGDKFAAEKDNLITRRLHEQNAVPGKLSDNNDFILEGGSIESDGQGTIFTTSQCLMAPNRNQPLTQTEVEEELKRRLCADHIIWLNHGNLIGDDTDGHIDTIVRICPDDTFLYIKSNNPADEQHEDFEQLEQELQSLRTAEGKPYRSLPLPMNDPIFFDEERLPATYANFLIINGAVIVPVYGQKEKDAEAIQQISIAFPNREIIPIDSNIIIRQHGSIHCLTMQYPEGEKV